MNEILLFFLGALFGHIISQWMSYKSAIFYMCNQYLARKIDSRYQHAKRRLLSIVGSGHRCAQNQLHTNTQRHQFENFMAQIDPKFIENLAQMLNTIGHNAPHHTKPHETHHTKPHETHHHHPKNRSDSQPHTSNPQATHQNEDMHHQLNCPRNQEDQQIHDASKIKGDSPVPMKRKPLRKPSTLNIVSDL